MSIETRLRTAVLCATSALALICSTWFLREGFSVGGVVSAVLSAVPLVAFVPFLAHGNRRSYAALTLCLTAYLTLALMELVANPAARAWASATILVSFGLFVLTIAYLRATRPSSPPL